MNSNYELRLLGRLDAPVFLSAEVVSKAQSYTEAVQTCWAHRRIKGMTLRTVAEMIGCHPPHVTDFLREGRDRRRLPADKIAEFESICGNRAISQWLARRAALHLMEEVAARMSA